MHIHSVYTCVQFMPGHVHSWGIPMVPMPFLGDFPVRQPPGEVVQLLAPACRSQGLPRKYSRGLLRLHVPWRNPWVPGIILSPKRGWIFGITI